jgi:ribonuclease VapC
VKVVLDTSALLLWLRGEPGAEAVHPLLPTAVMSAANWSETCRKLAQRGVDAEAITGRLRILGIQVEPLTEADAVTAAKLCSPTAGLSLSERCCLALGTRLNLTTVTADPTWADLDIPIQIIR